MLVPTTKLCASTDAPSKSGLESLGLAILVPAWLPKPSPFTARTVKV